MNIDQHLLESVGWTLIHSVWQAAVIFGAFFLLTKALRPEASSHKYAAWIGAMTLVSVCALITFFTIYLAGEGTVAAGAAILTIMALPTAMPAVEATTAYQSLNAVANWVDLNLQLGMRIWLTGSILLFLRIMSGTAYIYFLRKQSQPVVGNWEDRVNVIARGLHISRRIGLAAGPVSAPMVIGYLKPLVLFPAGMIAGLAPEQVEAILIHELAHVRRHDFLVNVFQCVLESIFFFNPFVWIISARIRVEREQCCDDVVINNGVEPRVYVRALAAIEGIHPEGQLAMSLLGTRNQLLNRMKRVMEKSVVKKEMYGARILPLVLVLVGLVCASWLSIGMVSDEQDLNRHEVIVSDTSITADGLLQKDRPDEDEEDQLVYSFHQSFDTPFIPSIPSPDFAPFLAMPSFPVDSIPSFLHPPGGDWEKFEEEFTARFRGEFGEFFNKNREQFEKLMQEFRKEHEGNELMFPQMENLSDEQLKAFQEQMSLMNPALENLENLLPKITGEAWAMQEQAWQLSREAWVQSDMAHAQAEMARAQEEFAREHEIFMLEQEKHLQQYEKEMIEQLTKDGYLSKGEKAKDLHIMNGEVTINGKKVREEHRKKYKEIIDRYNQRSHFPHRPE